jgi:hypothetical protein
MPDGAILCILFYAIIPVATTVMIARKYLDVRRARRWLATPGKVTASRVASRRYAPNDPSYGMSDSEIRHEPHVEYEYTVGGTKYVGKRIDLSEKISTYELESMLDRYPVGADVTVYYDPADPNTAVLDRHMPTWIWLGGAGCVAIMIAAPLVAAAVYFRGVDWLKAHLADPSRAPFVMAATGFGTVALLMVLGFLLYALKAAMWPTVRGRVVSSGVEAFRSRAYDDIGRRRMHHRSKVVYEYEVNGRTYRGDRVTFGVVSSTTTGVSKRTARRYPVGTEVDVHYDPKMPSESVLRPLALWHLIFLVAAGAVLWLAWAVGTGRV